MSSPRQVECRISRDGRHFAVRMVSFLKGLHDEAIRKEVRDCAYCGKLLPFNEVANDSSDALVELRAAEIAALSDDPEWQMPVGVSGAEDRAWYDRERWATHTVWPSDAAGWLAHAIVHHDEDNQ